MGLFEKRNPRATIRSAIRHAIIGALVGVAAYGIIAIWKPTFRDNWLVMLPLWTAICAVVSGFGEWQFTECGRK